MRKHIIQHKTNRASKVPQYKQVKIGLSYNLIRKRKQMEILLDKNITQIVRAVQNIMRLRAMYNLKLFSIMYDKVNSTKVVKSKLKNL